jgi:glycosyltransferase involved in cell wall biosynthesis/FMN phosphatase YigB (HAD superfamily)
MQMTVDVVQRTDGSESALIHLLSHLIEGQRVLILGSEIRSLCLESAGIGFDIVGAYINADVLPFTGSAIEGDVAKRVQFLIAGETNLPFRDSLFDSAIITEASLIAIGSKKIIDEAVRVVRNGGRIIISFESIDPASSVEHTNHIHKEVFTAVIGHYIKEIEWHDVSSKERLVCSLFIHKNNGITESNKIDIIMPTFNGRRSIRKAIKSVIYQTYRDWNLIVVNDGGEDVRDIIDEFGDNRIKYICSEHNGKSHALNLGIRCSSGEFIGYLDDDDILYPLHLEVLIKAAMENGSDFVYDDWYEVCIDESGREIRRYFEFRQDVSPSMLIFKNYINHKCILHRRSLLDLTGLYDEELEVLIDWDMIRRLSFASRPFHVWSVTSEHIQYYKKHVIENKITGLWSKDPERAQASLEKIIRKTSDLPATEAQLKDSIAEAMMGFSYYHQLKISQITRGQTEWIKTPFEWGLMHAISDMYGELQSAINRTQALEDEIADMRKSFIWIVTNKFHNVFIERFLPNGSKGRKLYNRGLVNIRMLASDGPKNFLWMIRNRIRNKYHNKKVAICSAVPEGTFSLPKSELVPLEDLSKRKIAVAVHVFYIDLFEEICAYLNHIPVKYSLFISISDERDRPNISDMAQRLIHAEHVSIKIVPNRGRDIAPLLIDFADNLNNYDYICHIHTKKSFYSKRERVEWRLYLFKMLLGSSEQVHAILSAFEKYPSVGIIYPSAFEEVPYWAFTWLSNKHVASSILPRIGVKFDPDEYIEFPAGSMFWAKKEALYPLFSLGLKREDFPKEQGQTDGTLQHTIERCFALSAEVQGLSFLLIKVEEGRVFSCQSEKNIFQYFSTSPISKIFEALPFASVVSFDIFDTLVTRPFSSPEMLFDYLEEHIAKIYGIKGFHKIRKDSEYIARQRKNWQGDVKISEIYAVFAEKAKVGHEVASKLLELEVSSEISILSPRKSVIDMAREAMKSRKKIIIVSDTYFERKYIEKILVKNNIDFYNNLYISSEAGKRKDRGDLWDNVLHYECVGRESLLHIGDNEQSDVQILVDRRFMHPIHIMKPSSLFRESGLGRILWQLLDPNKGWRESLLFGLNANFFCSDSYPIEFFYSKKPLSDPFAFGYTVFGPIVFSFMSWLLREAKANGIDHLKFIAREGFLLNRAFELIRDHPKIKAQGIELPHGSYFLCSRRASIFAALRTPDDISRLLERHFTGTVRGFFNYRLNLQDMKEVERKLGAKILNRELLLPDHRGDLFNILLQVFEILAKQASNEREALLEYGRIQGLFADKRIGIVDVGYSGSIQKALSSLLGKPLAGYYFVTDTLAIPLQDRGSICRAYFGEFIDPEKSKLPIQRYSLLLEAVMTAPSGQLLYFQKNNEEIEPVFREPGISQKEFEKISLIHEGILEFIKNILDSFGSNALDIEFPKDKIQLIYERVVKGDFDLGDLGRALSVEDNFCGNDELSALDIYKK